MSTNDSSGTMMYHLFCVGCRSAVIADTIAKRERIPRYHTCPICGENRNDTWRPIEGPADALTDIVGEYEVIGIELNKSGYTILEKSGDDE